MPAKAGDYDMAMINRFIESYARRVPNFYRSLIEMVIVDSNGKNRNLNEMGSDGVLKFTNEEKPAFNMALLKLSDLQWIVRLCRSIVKMQELTPRSS